MTKLVMNVENESVMKRFWKALFRERQIYMRTDGKVSYLPLRSYVQVLFVIFVFVVASSGAYIIFNLFNKNKIIIDTNERYSVMSENYETRLKNLTEKIQHLNKKIRAKQTSYSEQIIDLTQIYEIVENRHKEFVRLLETNGMIDSKSVPLKDKSTNLDIANIAIDIEQNVHQFNTNVIKVYNKENKAQFLPRYIKRNTAEYGYSLIPQQPEETIDTKVIQLTKIIDNEFMSISRNQIAVMEELVGGIKKIISGYKKTYKKTGFSTKIDRIERQAKIHVKSSLSEGLGGPYLARANAMSSPEYFGNVDMFEGEIDFRKLAYNFQESVEVLKLLKLYSLKIPIRQPIIKKHRVSSRYGYRIDPFRRVRSMHAGLDFQARTGTPVHATASGVVIRAKYAGSYGLLVEIEHGNGLKTRYAHLSKINVKKGQRVKVKQVIGKVGSTGRSTGPHLHYEVRRNNKPLNPMEFLKAGKYVQEKI